MIFSIRCSLQLHVIVRPDGVVSGGFIGLQLNGAGGVMRNEAPILETLRPIFGAHRHYWSGDILSTLIDHAQ